MLFWVAFLMEFASLGPHFRGFLVPNHAENGIGGNMKNLCFP
jgi:hypothetical protein